MNKMFTRPLGNCRLIMATICLAVPIAHAARPVPAQRDDAAREAQLKAARVAAQKAAQERRKIQDGLLVHAEKVARKWDYACARDLRGVRPQYAKVLLQLLAFAQDKPKMATDPIFEAFVLALIEADLKDGFLARGSHLQSGVFERVPLLNKDLGVRVWTQFIRHAFEQPDGGVVIKKLFTTPSSGVKMKPGENHAQVRKRLDAMARKARDDFQRARALAFGPALEALRPAAEKKLAEAKGMPAKEKAIATLQYVFTGGKVANDELERMLLQVQTNDALSYFKLLPWGEIITRTGNAQGLWVLLTFGPEVKDHVVRFGISQFEYLVGKTKTRYGNRDLFRLRDGTLRARLRRNQGWLLANRDNLAWDDENERFRLKGEDRFKGEPEKPIEVKPPKRDPRPLPPIDEEF